MDLSFSDFLEENEDALASFLDSSVIDYMRCTRTWYRSPVMQYPEVFRAEGKSSYYREAVHGTPPSH